jgi:hypothetical protein
MVVLPPLGLLSWLWSTLRTPRAVSYSHRHTCAPLLFLLHVHPALYLMILYRRQVPLIRVISYSIALNERYRQM